MKVIAAYLLAVLGGDTSPSAADLKRILGSVGVEGDDNMIELLLAQVKDKDITELIAVGREMLASAAPAGGSVAVAAPAGGAADAVGAAEPMKEQKDEAKEESEEEDMCFSLFD